MCSPVGLGGGVWPSRLRPCAREIGVALTPIVLTRPLDRHHLLRMSTTLQWWRQYRRGWRAWLTLRYRRVTRSAWSTPGPHLCIVREPWRIIHEPGPVMAQSTRCGRAWIRSVTWVYAALR